MYLDYVDYLELVKLYDMTDNLASSQPHHLAMFFGQAQRPCFIVSIACAGLSDLEIFGN